MGSRGFRPIDVGVEGPLVDNEVGKFLHVASGLKENLPERAKKSHIDFHKIDSQELFPFRQHDNRRRRQLPKSIKVSKSSSFEYRFQINHLRRGIYFSNCRRSSELDSFNFS